MWHVYCCDDPTQTWPGGASCSCDSTIDGSGVSTDLSEKVYEQIDKKLVAGSIHDLWLINIKRSKGMSDNLDIYTKEMMKTAQPSTTMDAALVNRTLLLYVDNFEELSSVGYDDEENPSRLEKSMRIMEFAFSTKARCKNDALRNRWKIKMNESETIFKRSNCYSVKWSLSSGSKLIYQRRIVRQNSKSKKLASLYWRISAKYGKLEVTSRYPKVTSYFLSNTPTLHFNFSASMAITSTLLLPSPITYSSYP